MNCEGFRLIGRLVRLVQSLLLAKLHGKQSASIFSASVAPVS